MNSINNFLNKRSNFFIWKKYYDFFWNSNNMLLRYLYIVIPIALLFVLYLVIYFCGGYDFKGYSFVNDYANSLVIPYIMLFGYYFTGWLFNYSNKIIEDLITRYNLSVKNQRKYIRAEKLYKIMQLFSYFIPLVSLIFIFVANENMDKNWYSVLPYGFLLFYKLVIIFTWYLAASLIIIAIFSLIKIHYVLKDIDIEDINIYDSDNNCGFFFCNKLIIFFLGISLYYLFAGNIIVFSDFNAVSFQIENTFYKYPWAGCIFLIMFFMYLATVLVTMFDSITLVSKVKQTTLLKKDINSLDYDKVSRVRTFPITLETITAFFSVWVIPFLMLLVTVYSAFFR